MIKKKIGQMIAILFAIAYFVWGGFVFYKWIRHIYLNPTMVIAIGILFLMTLYILYKYFYTICKQFQKKKWLIGILMFFIPMVLIIGFIYVQNHVHYLLRNAIIYMMYIIGIVSIPAITLMLSLLKEGKYKKIITIFLCVCFIYIYSVNAELVMASAETIVKDLSAHPITELLKKEDKETVSIEYLENYEQKLAKNGYLNRYDISQMIDFTDKKSKEMTIHYQDSSADINMQVSNKKDEEIQKLKDTLKADYYTFHYEKDKNDDVDIYIERYVINQTVAKEKNEEVVLKGQKQKEMIVCTNAYGTEEYAQSFSFSNAIKLEEQNLPEKISSFKILFAYDEEVQNFVPVVEDMHMYNWIDEYDISSTGVRIKAKKQIAVDATDYTLRINRYNQDLELIDKALPNNSYYYEYEPLVSKIGNEEDGITLDISFRNINYSLEILKNIEIIYGKQ